MLADGHRTPGRSVFDDALPGSRATLTETAPGQLPDTSSLGVSDVTVHEFIPPRRRQATKPPQEVETGDPEQDRHEQ